MNRPKLYDKTVKVLYDAYFNDTLEHGDCAACVVGNICKEASLITGIPRRAWWRLFVTTRSLGIPSQAIALPGEILASNGYMPARSVPALDTTYTDAQISSRILEEALRLVEATGYTVSELAQIEYAFESAPGGDSDEDHMFNGLVNVLEVLNSIHQMSSPLAVTVRPFEMLHCSKSA